MRSHDFIFDDVKVTITFFDDGDIQRLDEAIHRGDPLFGPYSVVQHTAKIPQFQDHLHLYKKQNQLFSINRSGSGHDGYHGYQMPGRVADALRLRYPGWNIPLNNIIESVSAFRFHSEIVAYSEGR
jgi:hypothetical protein